MLSGQWLNILDMRVTLWTNHTLPSGHILYPEVGHMVLKTLYCYRVLEKTDVSKVILYYSVS